MYELNQTEDTREAHKEEWESTHPEEMERYSNESVEHGWILTNWMTPEELEVHQRNTPINPYYLAFPQALKWR